MQSHAGGQLEAATELEMIHTDCRGDLFPRELGVQVFLDVTERPSAALPAAALAHGGCAASPIPSRIAAGKVSRSGSLARRGLVPFAEGSVVECVDV